MNKFLRLLVLASIPATGAFAQEKSLVLSCPLNDAQVMEPPKGGYEYSEPDKKVILLSKTDTVFRAAIDGKILSVTMNTDHKYEIVMYHGDYYFWMVGIDRPLVRKNATVKANDPIGHVAAGSGIEFLMFLDEAPVDPRPFLKCR